MAETSTAKFPNAAAATADDDSILPLPPIPHLHPLFNKRNIFPLKTTTTTTGDSSADDWFFDPLPLHFKKKYEIHRLDGDLEALDLFFWKCAEMYRDTSVTDVRFYFVTLQASTFGSFVKIMKMYIRQGFKVFVLPVTRICNIMDWAQKYSVVDDDDDADHKIHEYHRHMIVVAEIGRSFWQLVIPAIDKASSVSNTFSPLGQMLEYKAFNTVPVTRFSDILKVCDIQQLLDYDSEPFRENPDDDEEETLTVKRLNRSPVHRVESF